VASFFLPIGTYVRLGIEQIKDQGVMGGLYFAVIYILAVVLMVPASLLTIAAGFVYGPVVGTLIVSPASVIGASIAFILGRYFFRDLVVKKTHNKRFALIDRAIGQQGGKVVLLLRLSPVFPFNLLNYILSLTSVSLKSYVIASLVGMFPGTLLYVYSGSLIESVVALTTESVEKTWQQIFLYWAGLVATLAITIFITRLARNALRSATMESNLTVHNQNLGSLHLENASQ